MNNTIFHLIYTMCAIYIIYFMGFSLSLLVMMLVDETMNEQKFNDPNFLYNNAKVNDYCVFSILIFCSSFVFPSY